MSWVQYNSTANAKEFQDFFKKASNTEITSLLSLYAPKPTHSQGSHMLNSLHRFSIPIQQPNKTTASTSKSSCNPIKVKVISPPQQTLEMAQSEMSRATSDTNKSCSCTSNKHSKKKSSTSKKQKSTTSKKQKSTSKSANKKSKPSTKKHKNKNTKSIIIGRVKKRKPKVKKSIKVNTKLKSVL
jgi:hypothetical protein